MASLKIFLFALAACIFHFHTASLNIDIPNVSLQDSRNNMKTMRTRRDSDSCEKFIKDYKQGKYSHCIPLGSSSSLCNETNCPNQPGPPARIHHIFYLNNATKKLDLTITWEYPKFGLNNLCGFQIRFSYLTGFPRTNCIQLYSKDLLAYTIRYLNFNAMFNVTITSLPAFNNINENSRFVTLKSPDKCTLFRQLNRSLPWYCEITTNFSVACESGKINVTLQKPGNVDIDRYFSMITLNESPHQPINMSLHKKNESFVVYKGLQLDIQYVLQITFVRGGARRTVSSQPFTCKSKDPPEPTQRSNLDDDRGVEDEKPLVLISLISTAVFILLGLIICITCKWFTKVKKCIIRRDQTFSQNSDTDVSPHRSLMEVQSA